MGRQNKIQLEERLNAEQAIANKLREHNHNGQINIPRVKPVDLLISDKIKEWKPFWVRDPKEWECRTRSHDIIKQYQDLIKHIFQIYPVPKFLEAIWIDPGKNNDIRQNNNKISDKKKQTIVASRHLEEFAAWYIAVASGMSLYRECANGYLTRKEVSLFLNAPDYFTPPQNILWARARALGANLGTSDNIARSKLNRFDLKNKFWISTLHFFVRYPEVKFHEIEDLLDYISSTYAENVNFTLKGRTLESVREGSESWHRLQIKNKELGSSYWEGFPIPDWHIELGSFEKGNYKKWTIVQIKNGKDLVREGTKQHHCVGGYKNNCLNGSVSIWSLGIESNPLELTERKRALTLEVTKNCDLVQARGYANRLPKPDENAVLDRWCKDNNIRRSDTNRYF